MTNLNTPCLDPWILQDLCGMMQKTLHKNILAANNSQAEIQKGHDPQGGGVLYCGGHVFEIPQPQKTMSIHSYVRVSHENSKISGLSPESQMSSIIEYRKTRIPNDKPTKNSFEGPPGFYFDLAVSAWKGEKARIANRPAGRAMINNLQRGDHVVFYSIDRGFRRISDFGAFMDLAEKNGWIVHFIRENLDMSTPSGKLRAHIYAAMSEYYSSLQSVRTKEANAMMQARNTSKIKCPKKPEVDTTHMLQSLPREEKEIKQSPGKIWLYRRVSDRKQVDSQLGLEGQEKGLSGYAEQMVSKNNLLEIGAMVSDEGISGWKKSFPDRQGGKTILENARPGDHIVAWRFDRIFRSVMDMNKMVAEFDKRGITLHVVADGINTGDQNSRVWMNMLASIAQIESDIKSIRARETIETMRKKGMLIGKVPRGNKVFKHKNKKKVCVDWYAIIDCYSLLYAAYVKGMSYSDAHAWLTCIRARRDGAEIPTMFKYRQGTPIAFKNEYLPLLKAAAEKYDKATLDKIRDIAVTQANQEFSPEWMRISGYRGFKPNPRREHVSLPF